MLMRLQYALHAPVQAAQHALMLPLPARHAVIPICLMILIAMNAKTETAKRVAM
jgi:hypothetical protein